MLQFTVVDSIPRENVGVESTFTKVYRHFAAFREDKPQPRSAVALAVVIAYGLIDLWWLDNVPLGCTSLRGYYHDSYGSDAQHDAIIIRLFTPNGQA